MRKELTDEQKEKMQAAREVTVLEKKKRRRLSEITIGPYRCFCLDEFNWCVRKGDDETNQVYFPTLEYCIQYILQHQISDRAAECAGNILKAIKDAETCVSNALKEIKSGRNFKAGETLELVS